MIPCSPFLAETYFEEARTRHFPPPNSYIAYKLVNFNDYAVVSGEITGHWGWETIHKCLPRCPPIGPCCHDVTIWTWMFDRDYHAVLKAGWVYIKGTGFGDNDGAVPMYSSAFCASPRHNEIWPCFICPPIPSENKHATVYL